MNDKVWLKIICPALLLCFSLNSSAQAVNQLDDQGKRHGVWKKYYDNSPQLRYEGNFVHGVEIDTFKFFKPDSKKQPAAVKIYRPDTDTVEVRSYDPKGFMTSEGTLIGQSREGKWKYFKKGYQNRLIMVEHYQNDRLEGTKTTYFPNGQVTAIEEYKDGMKNGVKKVYSVNGTLLQEYHFVKDQLHGYSRIFDAKGRLESEGNYKKGVRDGEWKFYADGQPDYTEHYPLSPKTNR